MVERKGSSTCAYSWKSIEMLSIAHPKKISDVSFPLDRETKFIERYGGEEREYTFFLSQFQGFLLVDRQSGPDRFGFRSQSLLSLILYRCSGGLLFLLSRQ